MTRKLKAVASNSILLSVYFYNWRLIFKSEPFYSYPAVFVFFLLLPKNTLSRWLYFIENPSDPPPYQFTLFASSIYGAFRSVQSHSFLFNSADGSCRALCILPSWRRRLTHSSSAWLGIIIFAEFSTKKGQRLDYDYDLHSIDTKDSGRPGSTFKLQAPDPFPNYAQHTLLLRSARYQQSPIIAYEKYASSLGFIRGVGYRLATELLWMAYNLV